MLIRDAEVWLQGRADVRVAGNAIEAVGMLQPRDGETVIDAHGGALLPGLHDHHIHLSALAVAQTSVVCGPPDIADAQALAAILARPGNGWLRGIGYHESVAGMLDAAMLDNMARDRPVRIQHRSGRMWFLNTRAIDALLQRADPPPGLDRTNGRLFDEDRWLRDTLGSVPPSFAATGAELAAMGVTGLTDMSPSNDPAMAAHFAAEALPHDVVLAGTLALAGGAFSPRLRLGPAKLHLHEAALPDCDATAHFIADAHAQTRPIAVHCTTETELVFALAAIAQAGPMRGDRIEHAGIATDALIEDIAQMGLHVVSQPHFIAERGDRYLLDVAPRDHALLYRLAAFERAGVTLAAGSDAPFGSHDPWAAMRAAVSRRTHAGVAIGDDEALTPEEALALYLADPIDLTIQRRIAPGITADLCLLDRPWAAARKCLSADDVHATIIAGSIVHHRIDQAPV